MVEDVPFDGAAFLLFLYLIPNLGEPAVVAATEVLARYYALLVEGSEGLIQAAAIRRFFPSGLFDSVRRKRFRRDPLDVPP